MTLSELRNRRSALDVRRLSLVAEREAQLSEVATAIAEGNDAPKDWGTQSLQLDKEIEAITLGLDSLGASIRQQEADAKLQIAKIKNSRRDPAVRKQKALTLELDGLTTSMLRESAGIARPTQEEYWERRGAIEAQLEEIAIELRAVDKDVAPIELSTEEKFNLLNGR